MELSPEDNLQDLKLDRCKSHSVSSIGRYLDCDMLNEVIDINKIQFENDEYWLFKLPSNYGNQIQNINHWLHSDVNCSHEDLVSTHLENGNQKNFDSRTFTRPKKRFTRPSIEKYREAVYGIVDNTTNDMNSSRESLSNCGPSSLETAKPLVTQTTKPLSFDLSQPSNSYYFDNMLSNMRESDSFQNMSPPSLVNSICSTTFANLMESSFIKNDPILREIRDTDFTESILLQDSEAPMFQSITESCSSLNSDTPENFVKKISRSDTFKKKSSFDSQKMIDIDNLSNTYQVNTTLNVNTNTEVYDDKPELEDTIVPSNNLNETYRQTPKKNKFRSFRNEGLNSTFNVESLENFNSTKPLLIKRSLIRENTIENLKKQLNDPVQTPDINRLSYCLDLKSESEFNETQHLNKTVDIKRSSLSIGSTDSLDRMSSKSNSSRGSNRMLSMADVDAIVEMQEKSLQQVMSTPNVNSSPKKLWLNNFISPITSKENLSDSDVSSNEEYKSVRSSLSKGSLDHYSQKSLDSINYLGDNGRKMMQPPIYGSTPKISKGNPSITTNYNATSVQLTNNGKIHNVYKSNMEVSAPITNLKLMGQKLKASYTSLKPISTNLPVAPPINTPLNVTKTLSKTKKSNGNQQSGSQTKIVEVPPMPREKVAASDHVFVKPVHSRTSFLPRPTGIPRPSTRIPAPRSSNRPTSSRSVTQTFETRDSYQ